MTDTADGAGMVKALCLAPEPNPAGPKYAWTGKKTGQNEPEYRGGRYRWCFANANGDRFRDCPRNRQKRLNHASIGKFKSSGSLGLRRTEQGPTADRSPMTGPASADATRDQRRIGDVQLDGFGHPIGKVETEPYAGRPAGVEDEAALMEERPRE